MAISAAPASRPWRRPTRSRKMPQTGEKPNIPEKCALRIRAMTPIPTPRADAAMAYTAISPVIAPWARPMAIAPARMAGSRSSVRNERLTVDAGVFRGGARSLGSGRSANMQPKATAEKIAAITQDAASRADWLACGDSTCASWISCGPMMAPTVPAASMKPTATPRRSIGYISATAARPRSAAPLPRPPKMAEANNPAVDPRRTETLAVMLARPSRSWAALKPGRRPNRSINSPPDCAPAPNATAHSANSRPPRLARPVS